MESNGYGGNQEVHFLQHDLGVVDRQLEEVGRQIADLEKKGAEITGDEDREYGSLLTRRASLSRRRDELEQQLGTMKTPAVVA